MIDPSTEVLGYRQLPLRGTNLGGRQVSRPAWRGSHLEGGRHVYDVTAATGEVRCQTLLSGPSYSVENLSENFRPLMGGLPDILIDDGGKICMHWATMDHDPKPATGRPLPQVKGGFLDDSHFKRAP